MCIRDRYGVNLAFTDDENSSEFFDNTQVLFNDLEHSEKLRIKYNLNSHNHFNFLNAIKAFDNYQEFDLFVKIDDDDIYKTDYVKNIVDFINQHPCDICSSETKWELNGFRLLPNSVSDLGGNPDGTDFHLPPTFAFNKKALDAIQTAQESELIGWEDKVWRIKWVEAGLRHQTINNTDQFIWNVHGSNASIGHWLKIGNHSFGAHLDKLTQTYQVHGRYKHLLKRVWSLEEKICALEMPIADYEMAIAVHSKDQTKLKIEAFDKSKQLKLEEAFYGFDFRTGDKLTIFESQIKEDSDYLSIAHAIDTLFDEIIRLQRS